jgi:hypothetical protein
MNKQEILDAFIQAEKDWSEPIEGAYQNYTEDGLCWYFSRNQSIEPDLIDSVLRPIWQKHRVRLNCDYGLDFNGYGHYSQGRAERLEAIRKVINDLKTKLNENH